MIVTIFGATGQVGKQIVKQALWKGHKVKAFGRNIHEFEIQHENLELILGVLFDDEQVYHAIIGSDAVLSSIGGSFDGEDKARSLGMKKIISAMDKLNVKRIISVGGLGVLSKEDGSFVMDDPNYPAEYIPVGREHLQAYKYLESSDLDWTFIGSPNIIDAVATGIFNTIANIPAPGKGSITSGDLAAFMLQELGKEEFIKQRVGISN